MARKKVNLQWISNNPNRRATYKRRRDGLMKKANELTTLCGIKVCVVVYGEGEGNNKVQPETWPSEEEAKQFLTRFKEMPDIGSFKKTQHEETLLDNRCSKLHEQVRKLEHGNREDETLALLHDSMDGSRPGLTGMDKDVVMSLRNKVEMKMCKTKALLQQLLGQEALSVSSLVLPPASSSSQTQVYAYNYTEMQGMVPPEEYQNLNHITNLAANGGELDTVFQSAMASSSNDPSSSGCDVMQP
ncbi:hypothetical protein BS78_05G201500 [Paspalum vaginatum]|nr:hypothetical protein BS78_05G201500 [Paspalum vaginatum]